MYIHWQPADVGSIVYPDRKFLKIIYGQHNDSFTDYTKYRDADDLKEKIGTVGNGKKKKVNGPSISMDSTDHAKTANNGKMKGSKAYRGEQRKLIEAGKLQEAFDMDVADIKSTFPGKFDESINQAQKS